MIFRTLLIVIALCSLSLTARAQSLVLACNPWQPLADNTLPNQGLLSDIVVTAGARVGIEIEHKILPWNRIVALVKKGEIDGISCSTYADDDLTWLSYTDQAFWVTEVGFFVRKDSNIKLNKLEDLSNYTFGSLQGGNYTEVLRGLIDKDIQIIPYPKEMYGMKMLIENRFDILFTSEIVGNAILNEQNLERAGEVKYLETLFLEHIHPAISLKRNDAKKIAERLSKGYKLIKADGTLEHLFQKHKLYPSSYNVKLAN
ncbi:substrate-binding periplasmic protein [Kiloniella antarctica]|uniref:Substrate-binding periplasmic protein n=1 Tax=Kiloniella antarctica TaxID=1550907 RepID=A0ABW5BQ87_9PROT